MKTLQQLQALAAPQEPEHIVHSNGRYSPLLTRMMNKRVESNVKQVIHLYDEPPAAQPSPVQEPVAWMYQCTADNSGPVLLQHRTNWAKSGTGLWIETPLYTTPPAQPAHVPMTPTVPKGVDCYHLPAFQIGWKAAESAHGITKGQP